MKEILVSYSTSQPVSPPSITPRSFSLFPRSNLPFHLPSENSWPPRDTSTTWQSKTQVKSPHIKAAQGNLWLVRKRLQRAGKRLRDTSYPTVRSPAEHWTESQDIHEEDLMQTLVGLVIGPFSLACHLNHSSGVKLNLFWNNKAQLKYCIS